MGYECTDLSICDSNHFESTFVNSPRFVASQYAQDVLSDDTRMSFDFGCLLLLVPVDDISRSEDMWIVDELKCRFYMNMSGCRQRRR